MDRYCCFWCPKNDRTRKDLEDRCPTCSRTYGFPLDRMPKVIRDYRVIEPIGRGFYGATYVVERGPFSRRSVLKVLPLRIYEFFDTKNFVHECSVHADVSNGSDHIVGILDMFDDDVSFDGDVLRCHVAELEYVDGKLLADFVSPESVVPARAVAQIAIDLFKICDVLNNKRVNHNDLHAANIIVQELPLDGRRADAVDGSIRVVAIDLGSVSDMSRSDSAEPRYGDLHWIAVHLGDLVRSLLRDPDRVSDFDYRLASALDTISQSITPPTEHQRTPAPTDFIDQINDAYFRVTKHWRPWREQLALKSFDASYNAQTMNAWHVPQLLVDPDEQWLRSICAPGPQVIVGMRGCGKTMFLRAVQFHARAAQVEAEPNETIIERLRSDNYVGLFVSAQRLLDRLDEVAGSISSQFARLFVAYGLEAVRAVLHLRDIDPAVVSEVAHKELARVIQECVDTPIDLAAISSYELDQRLNRLLILMSRRKADYSLALHPSAAFSELADAIRRCSDVWATTQVLFLLDDVSTRYLQGERIDSLLSELLFQNPACSFKLTTEAQTIDLGVKSPGKNHPARVGRDLDRFDLGAEVYNKIKDRRQGRGRQFVERILQQRAQYFSGHPSMTPSVLLGDTPLSEIAYEIGTVGKNARKRKTIYRGISALAGMCVGDIGDVISLYERILRRGGTETCPIQAEVQSDCFQDFCSRRMYDLNRRRGYLKDVAISFAEASHHLLAQSCRGTTSGRAKRRIREYLSIYVRITAGDIETQTERLRDLIDAGVFVFAGGSSVPRTKGRDSNPTRQFKLTYRKIYGLANFIGLAERDRFELSGPDLERWLAEPTKELLIRNLGSDDGNGERLEEAESTKDIGGHDLHNTVGAGQKGAESDAQILMFPPDSTGEVRSDGAPSESFGNTSWQPDRSAVIESLGGELSEDTRMDAVVVGLGFERRTLESARRIFSKESPSDSIAVAYDEPGRRVEIESIMRRGSGEVKTIEYRDILQKGFQTLEGNVVIDITGLVKPVIFHAVRDQLRRTGRVWICYTEAAEYYPREADLEPYFRKRDGNIGLDELHGILTGEEGPYHCDGLLPYDADDTRQRVLCAFSSAKHERLLSLLDKRDYDWIDVVAPNSDTYRTRVAQIAAGVAARNNANSHVMNIGSNDVNEIVNYLGERYKSWCIDGELNFELGLTGSKLQAVACAVISVIFKISQCWYLRPKRFDPQRFTTGVGMTRFFSVSVPDLPESQ